MKYNVCLFFLSSDVYLCTLTAYLKTFVTLSTLAKASQLVPRITPHSHSPNKPSITRPSRKTWKPRFLPLQPRDVCCVYHRRKGLIFPISCISTVFLFLYADGKKNRGWERCGAWEIAAPPPPVTSGLAHRLLCLQSLVEEWAVRI